MGEFDEVTDRRRWKALRRRRRRYAWSARRHRVLRLLSLPHIIRLPGGRRWERHVHLFWRIRLPLWGLLAAAGWLIIGWTGAVAGVVIALAGEVLVSFGSPHGRGPVEVRRWPPGPDDGPSGVREPRRPRPSGGSGSAQLPIERDFPAIG